MRNLTSDVYFLRIVKLIFACKHPSLDAFYLEYHGSKSIDATVDGDALFFKPWKIAAKTQDSHITANRHPSHSAETFGHFQVFNNKFLTFLKHFTCTIRLYIYRCYGTCFENVRWTKPFQNCYLNSIYLRHQNTKAFRNLLLSFQKRLLTFVVGLNFSPKPKTKSIRGWLLTEDGEISTCPEI